MPRIGFLIKMNWDYIAGFFDGEGCIHKNDQCLAHNSYKIGIGQKPIDVLNQIKRFLNLQGIQSWIYVYKKESQSQGYHQLYIKEYTSVKKFLNNIKNRSIVKKKEIFKALSDPQWTKYRTKYSKIEKDQIRILNEYGFTQRQICKALGRTKSSLTQYFKREVPNYKQKKGVRLICHA